MPAQTKRSKETFILLPGGRSRHADNLEVLALGTNEVFEEGRPIKEIIQTIGNSETIPVVPWGAGKWIGAKGTNDKRSP